MGVKDTYIHEECMKELDTMFKEKTSFGEYFDNQRDAMIKAMQNKNKQQNVEWMERYEKRQAERIRISDTSGDELPKATE